MAIHIYTHTKPCPLMSGSVIRNNQKVETTQIPLAGGWITEMAVYPYNGFVFVNYKECGLIPATL